MHGVVETLCVHVTNKCNLSCIHCWSNAATGGESYLPVNKLLPFLERLIKSGLRHISISGGEAALYPDLLALVQFILINHLEMTITTNGSVQPSLIERLAEGGVQPCQQMQIRVSIDGDREDHERLRGVGSYDDALREISKIRKWAGWVGVNTVVYASHGSIDDLSYQLSILNVDEWAFITVVPRGRSKNLKFNAIKILSEAIASMQKAEKSGFRGRVVVWDYITHPWGGVLVDVNGQVLLPGLREEEDKILGHIDFITPEILNESIADRLHKDPVAYFNLPRRIS